MPLLAASAVSQARMTGSDKEETESEDGKLPPALRADPEAKTYIYRDFANLPDDPDSDDSPPPKRCNSESSIRVQKFPVKVSAMAGEISHDRRPRCMSNLSSVSSLVSLALCHSLPKGV